MPQMPASTFQIAIIIARQTLGYTNGNGGRREWDRISVTQLEKATGLSRQGAENAVNAGLGKWFDRRSVGQGFEYQLCNSVDYATQLTMQDSCTVLCNSVAQSDDELCNSVAQKLCNSVATQKKERKERTKRKKRERNIPDATHQDKLPTDQQKYFDAVCWIVGWDYHTLTKDDAGRVAQTVGVLTQANYMLDDLRRFFLEIWAKDWRWLKNQQRPTLTQLRQEIGKLRAGIPIDMPVNGKDTPRQSQGADAVDRVWAKAAEKGINL